jgi:rubrerythrin
MSRCGRPAVFADHQEHDKHMQPSATSRILDFAIANEEKAAAFYRFLAAQARREPMKEVFLAFAGEEEEHKAKLLNIKAGEQELVGAEYVVDLGVAEELDDPPLDLSGNMDYREALIVAVKAEQAAQMLYTRLANATPNALWKSTLLGLAQEEAKHKLRFELEYEELRRRSGG